VQKIRSPGLTEYGRLGCRVVRGKSFVLPDFVGSAGRVVVGPGPTEYGRLGVPDSPGMRVRCCRTSVDRQSVWS